MLYALSDIHGCRVALETILEMLPLEVDDTIVCLGDYIDRGSDTKGVIDLLLSLREQYTFHHLVGNHELMLSDALITKKAMSFFTGDIVGGGAMIDSYGGTLDNVPKSHWDFLLKETLAYYETESHILVHGGVEPQLPMKDQGIETLAWKRFHDAEPHHSGKTVICGHTIVGETPLTKGHTICIDTGAGKGGWITALQVETGKYYQANEQQQKRCGDLA